jgi:hypothetical protein
MHVKCIGDNSASPLAGRSMAGATHRARPETIMTAAPERMLLSIIELGGYPDFTPLYRQAGYRVESVASVRKALVLLKQHVPDVIVAEFNYQSDFRDRTSSLESLLAVVQRSAKTRVIVFYEKEHAHQLVKVTSRFPIHESLAFPIDTARLEASLRRPAGG